MKLTDTEINVFVNKVIHLGQGKRKEFLKQVDNLIATLERKIKEDASFKVKGFRKTGSIAKGTVLKPSGDNGVDADIAVFLDVSESEREDIDNLHAIIRKLLIAAYPTKKAQDFQIQPRTLGIHFISSGLDVDLVPVIPISKEPGYGWQPSSQREHPVKTSIQGQLDFIKSRKDADPRFKTIVRLLKKWRNEHELDRLRSFAIELIVAHLYDTHGAAVTLEDGVLRFWKYLVQSKFQQNISFPENGTVSEFPDDPVVILDPVNNSNNVTARLTDGERSEIVRAAQTAYETISAASWKAGKGDTLDLWKEIYGRSFTIDEE
jgi:tRNA nucleotidyltransferase (CCA-adding enzyme)